MNRRDLEKLVLSAAAGLVVGSLATKAEAAPPGDPADAMKASCEGSGSCSEEYTCGGSCKSRHAPRKTPPPVPERDKDRPTRAPMPTAPEPGEEDVDQSEP